MSLADIVNIRNPLNQTNPFQKNGVSAGVIPGTIQYQQENPQKTTLQQAYEQAMSKTTPAWVSALSNAMPSIAQIGALGATKGAFNQGYVADSLEREKQRQMAYNQYLQQQEQNKVKDFVQMAKDQMDIDRADDNTAYNRNLTKQQNAYKKVQDNLNRQEANEQRNIDNELKYLTNNRQQDILDMQKEEAKRRAKQQEIDNENTKKRLELEELKIKQDNDKAIREAQKEETKKIEEIMSSIEKDTDDLNQLNNAINLNSSGKTADTILTAINPFAKPKAENRFSPIYQNFTKETDPKKAEIELMKLGYNQNMSQEAFNENTKRLINEKRDKLKQKYRQLGFRVGEDTERPGIIIITDNEGNIIKEF